jgi:hypothetical protein
VYLKQVCEVFDINNFLGVSAINVQPWKNCEILCFQRVFHIFQFLSFFQIHNAVVLSLNINGATPLLRLCAFVVLTKTSPFICV